VPAAALHPGDQGTDNNVQIVLDVSDYEPEHIKVNLRDRNLKIRAKREVKESGGFRSVREINHEYDLPEDVDVENLVSHFDEHDGLLAIEAPRKGIKPAVEPKKIPIDRGDEGGCDGQLADDGGWADGNRFLFECSS
jgi:HSP20 family molecular chaperone IbpA